jgi:hypothetical protein
MRSNAIPRKNRARGLTPALFAITQARATGTAFRARMVDKGAISEHGTLGACAPKSRCPFLGAEPTTIRAAMTSESDPNQTRAFSVGQSLQVPPVRSRAYL